MPAALLKRSIWFVKTLNIAGISIYISTGIAISGRVKQGLTGLTFF
jgi:hypothetical protein